jgi:hypothetical protein
MKEREYRLPNGNTIKMTEEEFHNLVDFFLTLQKIKLNNFDYAASTISENFATGDADLRVPPSIKSISPN